MTDSQAASTARRGCGPSTLGFVGPVPAHPKDCFLVGGREEEYRIHCRFASRQSVLWYVLSMYSYPPPYYVLCTVRGDETGAENRVVLSLGWPCQDCSAGTHKGPVLHCNVMYPIRCRTLDPLVAGPDPSRCRVVWLDIKHAWVMTTGMPLHPQSSLCSSRPSRSVVLFPFLASSESSLSSSLISCWLLFAAHNC